MKKFIENHGRRISGTISCFDRIMFKGHLPLGWPAAMEGLLYRNGLLIKDFGSFAKELSCRLDDYVKQFAHATDCHCQYLAGRVRKEALVRELVERYEIRSGMVCILSKVEPLLSFAVVSGKGRPQLVRSRRQCKCFYFYQIDPVFGLMHVRIESWFPMTIQVVLNGHDWLERKLLQADVDYRKQDNAFVSIADPDAAQTIANGFTRIRWPQTLDPLARAVNPLLADVLKPMDYYWCTEQAEFATDIIFRSPGQLGAIYPDLLRHAITCFGADDVMRFLGRKLHGRFEGEVVSDIKQQRWPGARIKHRMKGNWIKMYDKHGRVLRIETVINQPKEFKLRRLGVRNKEQVMGWFPMRKGVSSFGRYREVAQAANDRYLEALAEMPDRQSAQKELAKLAEPVRDGSRSYRGFNPASRADADLFAAVMRGEHLIQGFRNAQVREQLYSVTSDPAEQRRQSHRVSRQLKRLHMHGLIAKVPRSTRWKVTAKGQRLMKTMLHYHHESYAQTLSLMAA